MSTIAAVIAARQRYATPPPGGHFPVPGAAALTTADGAGLGKAIGRTAAL